MKTAGIDRLETRVSKELKRSLRVYCANNDLSLREGIELAIAKLTARPDAGGVRETEGSKAGA